jgi:hypothetical protein
VRKEFLKPELFSLRLSFRIQWMTPIYRLLKTSFSPIVVSMLRYCLPVSRSHPNTASHCDLVPVEAHLFDPLARHRRSRTAVRETYNCLFVRESRRYQIPPVTM